MAETDITPIKLEMNEVSDDLLDSDGTVATTPADGWNILAGGQHGDSLVLKFLADGSGDTVVIKAGDRPPSQRKDLGDLNVVLAANDVRYICVESARFTRADGSILAVCTDAGTSCIAFELPGSPHTMNPS